MDWARDVSMSVHEKRSKYSNLQSPGTTRKARECWVDFLHTYIYMQKNQPCSTYTPETSRCAKAPSRSAGASGREHSRRKLRMLSVHRNLPLFYSFLNRNAWIFMRWCNYVVHCTELYLTVSTFSAQNTPNDIWRSISAQTTRGA